MQRLIREQLGTTVVEWLFVQERRSVTCGVALADGRQVVVKAHPPGAVGFDRLRAVHAVQRKLSDDGFACPRPLVGPVPLGRGLAVVDAMLTGGRRPDPRLAADRTTMACTLAAIVSACEPHRPLSVLDAHGVPGLPAGALWPAPADARLSLTGGGTQGAWIDDLGARARTLRKRAIPSQQVLGHGDWHVEHLRLDGDRTVAVYDWDSLVEAPEPFLLGCAVGGFTADWSVDAPPVVPTRAEATQFVADYESARRRRFSDAERTTIDAHWVEMTAWASRMELAHERSGRERRARYRHELAAHGAGLLDV